MLGSSKYHHEVILSQISLLLFWFWSDRRGGNFPGAIFSAMAPDNAALPRCSAWHDVGSGRLRGGGK